MKNAWAFFCHMDYCKEYLCKKIFPMEKIKMQIFLDFVSFGLLHCLGTSKLLLAIGDLDVVVSTGGLMLLDASV